MTEAMPFLQKYDITFLRPPAIGGGWLVYVICSFLMTQERPAGALLRHFSYKRKIFRPKEARNGL